MRVLQPSKCATCGSRTGLCGTVNIPHFPRYFRTDGDHKPMIPDPVQMLLRHGAYACATDDNNNSALHVAAVTGNEAVAQLLVGHMSQTEVDLENERG